MHSASTQNSKWPNYNKHSIHSIKNILDRPSWLKTNNHLRSHKHVTHLQKHRQEQQLPPLPVPFELTCLCKKANRKGGKERKQKMLTEVYLEMLFHCCQTVQTDFQSISITKRPFCQKRKCKLDSIFTHTDHKHVQSNILTFILP